MKKLLAVILAAFVMLCFFGCRQKTDDVMSGEVVSAAESEISDASEPENDLSDVSEVSGISEAQGQPSPIEQTEQSAIYLPAETDEVAAPPDTRTPAEKYTDTLSLEQQLGQMFFARCPTGNGAEQAAQYNVGGYILFGRDFDGQTPDSLRENIASYQSAAQTPMLIGVDEEGGSVVRVSAYKAFRPEKFRSPQYLYNKGGIGAIISDADEKDTLLKSLGINVNLAPVCDISEDPADFIYSRTLGKGAEETAEYISRLVEKMNFDGVGSVLKHFPGYGNNSDTHTGIAVDERPAETFFEKDFLPFSAGISSGAGSVLVSHNIVKAFNSDVPASLSKEVHDVLRNDLGFTGVIMTDDLAMSAITSYTGGQSAAVTAVEAGNDMLISSDLEGQYAAVLDAVNSGRISEQRIRQSASRVINWKMALGLIPVG